MIRRQRSAALMGMCLAGLMLAGCNLSIDKSDNSSGSSASNTQGSSSGTGSAQYSVGGSVTGLAQSGLVLASGNNSASVAAGATSFTLPALLASGATYAVAVKTQPLGQTCIARDESGTIAQASVTSVQVSCTVNTYPIGGTVTGANATGLVLANGTDTFAVPLGASTFLMPTKQPFGAAYTVTVQTSPVGLSCQVSNGSGTMPAAAVSTVEIVCGQWTWIDGASATGSPGTYGSPGVGSPSNTPPARSGAVSWKDGSGRLWLFGGMASSGSLNDLWQYDPGTSQWTWMGGASSANASGQYGMKGTEASGNIPGARQGAAGWVDSSGNFWLFGGQGYDATGMSGLLDDLWEYDTADGKWTWVSGESSAYAIGAMDPVGEPGARSGAVGWRDASDNFWLFGGSGTAASGAAGATNDLWEYSGGSWMLVSGSQTPAANGVYGTQGTAASTNVPGSRTLASVFVDSGGNLWLFGGQGYAAVGGSGLLNDLWAFSPTAKQWTWEGGWKTVNAAGDYGTKSTTSGTLLPGARYSASVTVDASGNLWLFGGTGYDGNGAQGALGDLWEYQVAAAQWIWMSGSQTRANVGSYGSEGMGALGNAPGARAAAVAWMDGSGDFWLFGGQGLATTQSAGTLNDLWQFAP
ncbi:MAG TPA: kelch repeat-containing protein [Steroidobacteraceae bacterium]|jgi:N-acetylneuraminic acid mutarotase|nr:kelch repeat-containing protein [Steroidobacteraceae bacterium]